MSVLEYNTDASHGESHRDNVSPFKFDRNLTRDPENIITIFTTSAIEQFSSSASVKFAACPKGQRFLKVGTISDPKYFHDTLAVHGEKDQRRIMADDGRWVAMDWLNPNNCATMDQDYDVPFAVDDGTNLLKRGLFFIVRPFDRENGNAHDHPTEQELQQAEKRRDDRRNALVRKYHEISLSEPGRVRDIMTMEMIDALNFAGVETPFNTTVKQKVQCVICGDQKLAKAKFHRSESLGIICIEPTVEGWKAAVLSGLKKADDVPEEFREKRGPGRPPIRE